LRRSLTTNEHESTRIRPDEQPNIRLALLLEPQRQLARVQMQDSLIAGIQNIKILLQPSRPLAHAPAPNHSLPGGDAPHGPAVFTRASPFVTFLCHRDESDRLRLELKYTGRSKIITANTHPLVNTPSSVAPLDGENYTDPHQHRLNSSVIVLLQRYKIVHYRH